MQRPRWAKSFEGKDRMLTIRSANPEDRDSTWAMLEPVIRAGEVFALSRSMNKKTGLAYWFAASHTVFTAEEEGKAVGSYYLQPNQPGGGAHVANCGYLTAEAMQGRGIAGAMCEHSLEYAKAQGYRAMQFNFVIRSNEAAVRLWQRCGFRIVGTLPDAFEHPRLGFVDAFVMFHEL
jgi:RimJ/RimL family protein N-acetyltransferase